MPATRIFLSSTCYDLVKERDAVQKILDASGHKPLLSDKDNVHYNPDKHTHESCLDEVSHQSDMLVGILHSRKGGAIFSEAFKKHINIDLLKSKGAYPEYLTGNTPFSITHCEILKAIEIGIPYIIFAHQSVIDQRHQYETWLKTNKKNPGAAHGFSDEMISIFNFIKFVNNLFAGNGIHPYISIRDLQTKLVTNLSFELKARLDERLKLRALQSCKIIPDSLDYFTRRIGEKLKADYKMQAGLHSVINTIIFNKKGGCHYILQNTVIPKTDYYVYHFTANADKEITEVEVLKFRNINSASNDQFIGYIEGKSVHLFLFNKSRKGKAFTVELELKIKEYANDLVDRGTTLFVRNLSDANKKYKRLEQTLVFPRKDFKNLKLVCREMPGRKKCNESLTGTRKKDDLHFELKLDSKNLVYSRDPILRIEMTCLKS